MALSCLLSFPSIDSLGQEVRDQSLENLLQTHAYRQLILSLEKQLNSHVAPLDVQKEAYYLCLLSEAHYKLGDLNKSKSSLQRALKFVPQMEDSILHYRIFLNQANILNAEGKFSELHNFLTPAFQYASKHQHARLLHDCHLILGGLSIQNNKPDEALIMYQKAHNLSLTNHWTHLLYVDEMQMALAYCFLQQTDSAKILLDKAIATSIAQKDSAILATSYNILGYYYLIKNDQKAWRGNILTSLKIAEAIQHPAITALGYSQLVEYSLAEKKYDEAIQLGQKAYQSIPKETKPLFHVHVDSLMYEAYKGKGDTKSALKYFENYFRGRTAILSINQAEKLEEIKSNFEIKEKNLQLQNQALELENSKKRSIILFISNGVLLILLVGRYFFKRNKQVLQNTLYKKEKMTGLLLQKEKIIAQYTGEKPESAQVFVADANFDSHTSELFTEDKKELYNQMIQAIEDQKLYLNANLDVNLVVTTLGTNKTYLYKAISQHAKSNFRMIINRYRVEEAKRLLERLVLQNSNDNIEHIYVEAGFNSPSSYYRIFRNLTGLTPREYMQEYARDIQP